jgi:hypothetical protein
MLALLAIAGCGSEGAWQDTSIATVKHYPVAAAGPNQSVDTDDTVTLDGSDSSDIDGDTLIYNWSFKSVPTGSNASLSNSSSANPSFTTDLNGTYTITLVVNDGEEDGDPDRVSVVSTGTVNKMRTPGNLYETASQPEDDFLGKTFSAGENGEAALFFAERKPYSGETSAEKVIDSSIGSIASVGALSKIGLSKPPVSSDTALAQYRLTTDSAITPTELLNQVLQKISPKTSSGSITDLPTASDSSPTGKTFRLSLTALYESKSLVILLAGVALEDDYPSQRNIVDAFVDGTNVRDRRDGTTSASESFSAGSSEADLLFVVGNSSGMGSEQTALVSAVDGFTAQLDSTGIDYRLGVITTDSDTIVGETFTDTATTFASNVAVGTGGSSSGSGIWFAEKGFHLADPVRYEIEYVTTYETIIETTYETVIVDGVEVVNEILTEVVNEIVTENIIAIIDPPGTITAAGHPRQNADTSIIFFCDTADSYTSYSSGASFDTADNLFIDTGYTAYSVVKISSAGQYGGLAFATGGSVSPIGDTSVLPEVMEFIADGIAGGLSNISLSQTPMSSTITVTVSGADVSNGGTDGWLYNVSNNSIVFYGSAVPSAGSSVEVSYERING